MTISFIDMKMEDVPQILSMERAYFSVEGYNEEQMIDMLNNKNYDMKVLKNNNIVCGYIIIYKNVDFDEIFKIGVHQSLKRKGLGKIMMDYAKANCPKKLCLEVRSVNLGAVNFYLRCGFYVRTIRQNYYSLRQNALLMEFIK